MKQGCTSIGKGASCTAHECLSPGYLNPTNAYPWAPITTIWLSKATTCRSWFLYDLNSTPPWISAISILPITEAGTILGTATHDSTTPTLMEATPYMSQMKTVDGTQSG